MERAAASLATFFSATSSACNFDSDFGNPRADAVLNFEPCSEDLRDNRLDARDALGDMSGDEKRYVVVRCEASKRGKGGGGG
jgi:hypothetical protein